MKLELIVIIVLILFIIHKNKSRFGADATLTSASNVRTVSTTRNELTTPQTFIGLIKGINMGKQTIAGIIDPISGSIAVYRNDNKIQQTNIANYTKKLINYQDTLKELQTTLPKLQIGTTGYTDCQKLITDTNTGIRTFTDSIATFNQIITANNRSIDVNNRSVPNFQKNIDNLNGTLSSLTKVIPNTEIRGGWNTAALVPQNQYGPNCTFYQPAEDPNSKGTATGLIWVNVPVTHGNVYRVSFVIGDRTMVNPANPANAGNITIYPWGNAVLLKDDPKVYPNDNYMIVRANKSRQFVSYNILTRDTAYPTFYIGFHLDNLRDIVAIDTMTIQNLGPIANLTANPFTSIIPPAVITGIYYMQNLGYLNELYPNTLLAANSANNSDLNVYVYNDKISLFNQWQITKCTGTGALPNTYLVKNLGNGLYLRSPKPIADQYQNSLFTSDINDIYAWWNIGKVTTNPARTNIYTFQNFGLSSTGKADQMLCTKSDYADQLCYTSSNCPNSVYSQWVFTNVPSPVVTVLPSGAKDKCDYACDSVLYGGNFQAITQNDGNLVVYDFTNGGPGKVIWASNTAGQDKPPYRLIMQADGNLALYGKDRAIWFNGTGTTTPNGPYNVVMETNGNLVVYDKDKKAVWSSNYKATYLMISTSVNTRGNMYLSNSLTSPNWTQITGASNGNLLKLQDGRYAKLGTDNEIYVSDSLTSPDWKPKANLGNFGFIQCKDGSIALVGGDRNLYIGKSVDEPGSFTRVANFADAGQILQLNDGTFAAIGLFSSNDGAGKSKYIYTTPSLKGSPVWTKQAANAVLQLMQNKDNSFTALITNGTVATSPTINSAAWTPSPTTGECGYITQLNDGTFAAVNIVRGGSVWLTPSFIAPGWAWTSTDRAKYIYQIN